MVKETTEASLLIDGFDKKVNEPGKNRNFLGRSLYFLWHFHKKLVIGIIVLFALLLLGLRGTAYYIESHPEKIETLIEDTLGTKVRFSQIKVEISPLFPSVSLKNIAILDAAETETLLKFAQLKIEFNVWRSLWLRQPIIETFKLDGISAIIRRDSKGQLFIGELSLTDREADNQSELNLSKGFLYLLAQPVFQIINSEFYIVDQLNKIPPMLFGDINIKLQNQQNRHQISAEVSLNNTATRLDLRLDFNGDIQEVNKWDGTVYTAIKQLQAENFIHLLGEDVLQVENLRIVDFDLSAHAWANISRGLLHKVRGAVKLKDTNLFRVDEETYLNIDELTTNIHIDRGLDMEKYSLESGDWNIDLNNIKCEIGVNDLSLSRINIQYKTAHQCVDCMVDADTQRVPPQVQFYIDSLDFSKTAPLVHFFSPLKFHEQFYRLIKPRGQVKDSYAQLTLESLSMPINITDYQLQTSLRDFGLNAFNKLPEMRNFSADFLINNQSGRMEVDSHNMRLYFSSLFRDSWPIDHLSGTVEWQKDATQWLIQGSQLSLGNNHLKANARVKLWIPEAASTRDIFMDLSAYYHAADVSNTSLYLPVGIMKEGLVNWLDKAIVAGTGTDGGAVFRGKFGDFPYDDSSGNMDILFNLKHGVLNYIDGWPKLKNLQASLQFTGQGMRAEATHIKILDAVSKHATVDIERYKKPVLHVTGDIAAKMIDAKAFLTQSQVVSDAVLQAIDGQGDIGINLNLTKPLKNKNVDTQVKVTLKNVQYIPPGLNSKPGLLDNLNGEIIVHNKRLSSNNLHARLMGQPAQVKISTISERSREARVNVRINSRLSTQKLIDYEIVPAWLQSPLSHIDGLAAIAIDVNMPYEGKATSITVSSDLMDVTSRLPLPLNKRPSDKKNLTVSYEFQPGQARMKLDYAEQIAADLLLDTTAEQAQLLKANIHFGSENAKLPKSEQLLLTGVIDDLDLSAWEAVFIKNFYPSGNNRLKAAKTTTASQVKTIKNTRHPIPVALDLDKLVIPDIFNQPSAVVNEPEQRIKNHSDMSLSRVLMPVDFPTINGKISQLYLGEALLGKTEISSTRLNNSIHFNHLSLAGDLLNFKGNAIWNQWKGEPRFDMEGHLHFSSLEQALKQFGFPELIRGAETNVSGSFGWPGSPVDFSREDITGKINLDLRKGRLISSKQGTAARLLGILNLLNMNEIFRRITLNFSDVSKRGLEFDTITGDFGLREGDAYTDNYLLNAPSLILASSGRLGLIKHDIDMTIIAIPDVSGTLPLAGAVVAGPTGAAVVWIGQKILGDKLNRITALQYKVSGGWEDPKIKQQPLAENALKKVKKISGLDKFIEVKDGFLEKGTQSRETQIRAVE